MTHVFLVAGISDPVILGLDWLTENRCKLDFASDGVIDIDGIEIPCVSKPDQHRSTPCNVTAVGETILPPKSENILVGKVAGMHNTPNTVI